MLFLFRKFERYADGTQTEEFLVKQAVRRPTDPLCAFKLSEKWELIAEGSSQAYVTFTTQRSNPK